MFCKFFPYCIVLFENGCILKKKKKKKKTHQISSTVGEERDEFSPMRKEINLPKESHLSGFLGFF